MTKWAVRSSKVDDIRKHIVSYINVKWRSWDMTQKAISERLQLDRVRVNRMLASKVELISLEALVSIAESSGLDVSINVTDQDIEGDGSGECPNCRHHIIDFQKDNTIYELRQEIMKLQVVVNAVQRAVNRNNA
ncbi:MAG: XRE family transcriptional regulator [Janthinobacterium lividum]